MTDRPDPLAAARARAAALVAETLAVIDRTATPQLSPDATPRSFEAFKAEGRP